MAGGVGLGRGILSYHRNEIIAAGLIFLLACACGRTGFRLTPGAPPPPAELCIDYPRIVEEEGFSGRDRGAIPRKRAKYDRKFQSLALMDCHNLDSIFIALKP